MKKRWILSIILALLMSACALLVLVGCDAETDADAPCTHTWQDTSVRTEPTCTAEGSQEQKCAICGATQAITIEPIGHVPTATWSSDESGHWHTCTRDHCGGKCDEAAHIDADSDHTCEVCTAPMSNHTGGTATCTDRAVCSICGDAYGELAGHILDADGQCDHCDYCCTPGLLFKDIDATTTAVIGLRTDTQAVVIPETYLGKTVVSIERAAFYGRDITSVTIPSTIRTIGEQAFGNCTALEQVHIDLDAWLQIDFAYYYSSVKREATVESNPLANPKAKPYVNGAVLSDIVIPDGVTEIKPYAFFRLKANSVTIPRTLEKVGQYAFWQSDLTYVYTPDIETWLGVEFQYFNGLIRHSSSTSGAMLCLTDTTEAIKDLVIPDGVTRIGSYAFEGYTLLESVTMNDDLRSIGKSAFSGCENLRAMYLDTLDGWCNIELEGIEASPMEANSYVVVYSKDKTRITELVIPSGVTEIGANQFNNWDLTKVTFHNGVTKIGMKAFHNCSGIKEVHIPDVAFWCAIDFVPSQEGISTAWMIASNPIAYGAKLYVNSVEVTELEIPEGVTSISSGAFWGLKQLTSVTIPRSVKTIGYSAFGYCRNLTAVYISDLAAWCNIDFVLPDIWMGKISYCGSPLNHNESSSTALLYLDGVLLEDLDLSNIAVVKPSAFYRCKQLRSVTFGSRTTSVGDNAFYTCNAIENVYITDLSAYCKINFASAGATMAYVSENAKIWIGKGEDKEELIHLVIPSDVTAIGTHAFWGMKQIESVTFHENVTAIGERAFFSCRALRAVYLPNIETWLHIDLYDFYSHPLYNVTDGIMYVNNEPVTELTIPAWMEDIPSGLFYRTAGITTLYLHSDVRSVGTRAFSDCKDLVAVHIPSLSDWLEIEFSGIDDVILSETTSLYIDGEKLEHLVIPETVTEIKPYTFAKCAQLLSLTLHDGVEKIGISAFDRCANLEKVVISSLAAWCNIEFGEFASLLGKDSNRYGNPLDNTKAKLYLRTEQDGVAHDELITELVLGGDITHVSRGAFFGAKQLTALTVNGAVVIDAFAFHKAQNLATVTFHVVPTSIGEYAFYDCKIQKVIIPSVADWVRIQFGGDWASPMYPPKNGSVSPAIYLADDRENALTTMTAPDGTTIIGSYTFAKIESMTEVTLPADVQTIELYAFFDSGIQRIIFNGTVEQWLRIEKAMTESKRWYGASLQTVECTDGTLTINGEGFFTFTPSATEPTTGE